MVTHFEVRHLLFGERLLEGGIYFTLGTQKGGAYLKPQRLLEEIRHSGIAAGINYINFITKIRLPPPPPTVFISPFGHILLPSALLWYLTSLV